MNILTHSKFSCIKCQCFNSVVLQDCIWKQRGTTKVRNEIETKWNETKRSEMKQNETKRNEMDQNETKWNKTKRNEV